MSDLSSKDFPGSKTVLGCIDMLAKGPKWIAAKQNGKPVSSYKKQPFVFIVADEDKKSANTDPVFRVGNLTSGYVSAKDFLNQKELTVTDDYKFINGTAYISGKGYDKVAIISLNSTSFSYLKDALAYAGPGTTVTFDNIKVSNPLGMRVIDGKSYLLH